MPNPRSESDTYKATWGKKKPPCEIVIQDALEGYPPRTHPTLVRA